MVNTIDKMDETYLRFEIQAYLDAFEHTDPDKLKIDDERKRRLQYAFKQKLKKLALIEHEQVDKEIKKLNKRVDSLFYR